MNIKILDEIDEEKVFVNSMKIIEFVNEQNCNAYDTISSLSIALGAALTSFKQMGGQDHTEEILIAIRKMVDVGELKK